jgi:hypothetical protein
MKTGVFVRISWQTRQTRSLEKGLRPQEGRAGRKAGATAARQRLGGGGCRCRHPAKISMGEPAGNFTTKRFS